MERILAVMAELEQLRPISEEKLVHARLPVIASELHFLFFLNNIHFLG